MPHTLSAGCLSENLLATQRAIKVRERHVEVEGALPDRVHERVI
ncbi:MAG: hypothetical protein WBA88_16600 [Pseudaminobacter sp.]